jgi:hypothetical protein
MEQLLLVKCHLSPYHQRIIQKRQILLTPETRVRATRVCRSVLVSISKRPASNHSLPKFQRENSQAANQ